MVSSIRRKIISLAISLLVVVISLTSVALGANAPNPVTVLARYTPGFAGTPGKMARDVAGNFYVTDFWGKGIVKLNRQGAKIGFIATLGRPSAVAVLPDNRLAIAMHTPQPYIAFYAQKGSAPGVTGEELSQFGAPTTPLFRPTGITVDNVGYIYVVDSGSSYSNVPKVRVYDSTGVFKHEFGNLTPSLNIFDSSDGSAHSDYFKQPMGIAYETELNQIVIADTMNSRLLFFSKYDGVSNKCTYQSSMGAQVFSETSTGYPVQLGDPTDVAFEYNGTALIRMYVTERSRGEIAVVNMGGANKGYDLKRLNSATVGGGEMQYPSGVVFEKTTTGGVLYVSNALTGNNQANVLALGLDNGTVPTETVTLTMSSIAPAVYSATLQLTGTVSNGTVTCSANGGTAKGGDDVTTTGGSTWTSARNINLKAGPNYIICQATDPDLGITTFKEAYTYRSVIELAAAPTLTISQPTSNIYTTSGAVTVSGTVSSGAYDAAYATIKLTNSKFPSSDAAVYTLATKGRTWSAVVNLAEGSNDISVTAWMQNSQTSSPSIVTVSADFTSPDMTVTGGISFLSNGSITNKAVQNLDGIIYEANLDNTVTGLNSIQVNGVGVPLSARVALGGNKTYFSVPVTLHRGSNTVTVTATDKAGRTTTVNRSPILSPEIPPFAVAFPADNSLLHSGSTVTSSASATADSTFTSVDCDGSALTLSAGTWSGACSTAAGFNTHLFTATNASHTVTLKEKRTINNSQDNVDLAIITPAADMSTYANSVTIYGYVIAGGGKPSISVDSANPADAVLVTNYTADDGLGHGTFNHTVNLSTLPVPEGLHTVRVIASNGVTIAIRNIIRDTIKPELTIVADSKPMPTTLTGSIDPAAKLTATRTLSGVQSLIPADRISYGAYNQTSDYVVWTADLNGYPYDTVVFTAIDAALNVKTLAYATGIPDGDVDGDGVVRLADALAALRQVAFPTTLTDEQKFRGDVGTIIDGHVARSGGDIDIACAVQILNKAYGLTTY